VGFQPDTQGIERTQHEPKLGAAVPSLDADDPLATDFNALGQCRLAQPELLAAVPDDRAEVIGSANEHGIVAVR